MKIHNRGIITHITTQLHLIVFTAHCPLRRRSTGSLRQYIASTTKHFLERLTDWVTVKLSSVDD